MSCGSEDRRRRRRQREGERRKRKRRRTKRKTRIAKRKRMRITRRMGTKRRYVSSKYNEEQDVKVLDDYPATRNIAN